MVNRVRQKGQATSEFILMLAVLTLVGVWIVHAFIGTSAGGNGSVQKMSTTVSKQIGTE